MGIAISYTRQVGGSTVYSVNFEYFTDENLPRAHLEESTVDYSLAGTTILGGPARISKRIWAISSILSTADAQELEAMYRVWLSDKVTGIACLVSLTDNTFTPSTLNVSALFSTAPSFTKFSANEWLCSVGLTEA